MLFVPKVFTHMQANYAEYLSVNVTVKYGTFISNGCVYTT